MVQWQKATKTLIILNVCFVSGTILALNAETNWSGTFVAIRNYFDPTNLILKEEYFTLVCRLHTSIGNSLVREKEKRNIQLKSFSLAHVEIWNNIFSWSLLQSKGSSYIWIYYLARVLSSPQTPYQALNSKPSNTNKENYRGKLATKTKLSLSF